MSRTRLVIKGKGLEQLQQMMLALGRKPFVKVGVLGTQGRVEVKKGKKGTSASAHTTGRAGSIDNVALAVIHEYGVPQKSIPPRPFLRSTFEAKRREWGDLLTRMAPAVLRGKLTVEQALALLGQRAAQDVKSRITTGSNFAPNAPSTIRRKGSSRPLVDTGRLVASISYEVVSE